MSLFSSSQQFYGYVDTWDKPSLLSSEIEDSFNQGPFHLQLCTVLLVKSMGVSESTLILKLSTDELDTI